MLQFLSDLQQFRFLRYALLTGLMASVACRIVTAMYRADHLHRRAIAHCTLAWHYRLSQWEQGLTFLSPGRRVCANSCGPDYFYMLHRSTMRLDTILNAVWAIGMAMIFISKTGGNKD
jgi:hypothetical protein